MRRKKPRPAASQPAPQPVEAKRDFAPRLRSLIIPFALCVITLLAYSNSFHAGFVVDSDYVILRDPRVHAVTIENLNMILNRGYWWLPPEKGLYRPFTTLTYLFNYAVLGNGEQPAGYHSINLLLHSINVLLLYGLALRILKKSWPAAFIAALWAVHPVLTESVTNIIGRADLLAATAVLSGFWMYLKSTESTGWHRAAWLAGLMAVTTVGVFSKESAIVILGVVALYEFSWWKERKQLRGLLLGCSAIAPPFLAWWYLRSQVMAHSMTPVFPFVDNPLVGAHFLTGRLTAIVVLAKYLWLLVWPVNLSWNYYYAQIPLERGTMHDWTAWITIVAVIVVATMQFKRNRLYFFFAAFAFVTIVPVSNLIILIGTIMAERFLYLPSIGFVACVVLAAYALGQRVGARAFAPAVLCLMITVLGVRTWERNLDWHDNLALMTADVRSSPNSFASHESLATELYLADPSHSNIAAVIDEAEKSLAILDPLPDSLNSADVYANAGDYYERKADLLSQTGADGKITMSAAGTRADQRALQILLRGVSIDKLADEQNRQRDEARGMPETKIPHVGSLLLYQVLCLTNLRLGQYQKAYEAAAYARLLAPFQPETYLLMANTLFEENQSEQGGRALMEAYLIAGDPAVLSSLQQYFRSGLDPTGCSIGQSPNGPFLNNSCEPVHKLICEASSDLNHIDLEAQRPDLADQIKTKRSEEFGCAAGSMK
jgi:tetratricopeptide (TPR) repeat protein